MKRSLLTLLPLLFILFSVNGQVNLTSGLMAYYPFNGNANDASGNNNNPSFNNATLTADRLGNPNSAYHFNGTSNYMQIPNSASLNSGNKLSIAAWVKVSGFYAGTCHGNRIIMKGNSDFLVGNYTIAFDDNAYTNGQNCVNPTPDPLHQNFYSVNTTNPTPGYTPYIQTNQWYSVVYTNDGTTANLYVNCQLKISSPAGSATFTNSDDLFLGRLNSAQYPYWFNGDLDEVRIYNRALTIDEVNTLGGCLTTPAACVPTFQKRYGGTKNDYAGNVIANADQTYVMAGYTTSFSGGNLDGYLQKTDKYGNIIWSKTIGGAGTDAFWGLKPTADGGYIAVGNSTSFGGATNGVAWMVKTDGTGNVQWAKKYDDGNANGSVAWSVIATSDGGYALSGVNNYSPGVANGMVIKTDNNGNVQWAKSFDSGNSDQATDIIEDNDSLVVISLQYGQSSSYYDAVIMKLNRNNGTVVWGRSYDIDFKSNWPGDLTKTATGYGFSVYDEAGFSLTSPEQVIVQTDVNGSPLSLKKIADIQPRIPGGYTPTSDGGYIVSQSDITNTNPDIHIIKLSSTGTIQWTRKYAGTGSQSSARVRQTPDGGYIFAATNNSTPAISDSNDIYIIKTDSLGNTPGCTVGSTTATATAPSFVVNSSFVWSNITTLSFGATSISPVATPVNTNTTPLCISCVSVTDTIVDNYTPVLSIDKCKNIVTVADGSKYNAGDTVLLIQMKGAAIDTSSTATFGTITNYKNAGNYEFNYVKSKNGNSIELKNFLTRQYDLPDGKVQLIRVPFYQKLTTTNTFTCKPWDGSSGGVLVFNVADTLSLNADIDVSGKGFRGTAADNHLATCHGNQYFYDSAAAVAGFKGEGIYSTPVKFARGRGKIANGGGGGNGSNAGGAGGGNFGIGGLGGREFACSAQPQLDNGGIGGTPVAYTNTANKIFMGGAGGTGDQTNNSGSTGGNGGGIVIISASAIQTNNFKINSKGNTPPACPGPNCADGQGGGGAGGTVILNVTNYLDNTTINNSGGNGGSYSNVNAPGYYGPGGGGGGGALWLKNSTVPANVTIINTGGVSGTWVNTGQTGGALGGNSGGTLFNALLPAGTVPFVSTFDSAKLNLTVATCTYFKFSGLDGIDNSKVVKWQWYLGDGATDSTQNIAHSYNSPGVYPVKLTATDFYGCVANFYLDLTVLCRCEAIKLTTPNPARDIITVSGLGCGTNTLILYNMLGQKIAQKISANATETFYVSNLAKGMYLIKIINNKNNFTHLKVEKM